MGWARRILALFLGLIFILSPLWPIGLLFLLYLAFSLRRRPSRRSEGANSSTTRIPLRLLLGLFLIFLSAVAYASGGVFSPLVFLVAGGATVLWPLVLRFLPLGEVVSVPGSVLLRSKYLPFKWWAIAELKPGAEQFPRAASSFAGTLLVFTDTGRAFSAVSCLATGRREAEAKLLAELRASRSLGHPGAYLLPLDSDAGAQVFRLRLARSKIPMEDLTDYALIFSGLLVFESVRGVVRRAGAFEIQGPSGVSTIPGKGSETSEPPLTWEVLDAVGKRTRWPEPDGFSNLLDSMSATRGVPVGERVKELASSGSRLTVQTLSGEEVETTRAQFRAIVSIYS